MASTCCYRATGRSSPIRAQRAGSGRAGALTLNQEEIIGAIRSKLTDPKTGEQRGLIVFVSDACRDNPFEVADDVRRSAFGRNVGVEPRATAGVFSIYSAGTGQTALDRLPGNDPHPNSVFMRIFNEHLMTPGLHLGDVVVEVRGQVAKLAASVIDRDTGRPHRQTPAYYDETQGGRIFLAGLPKAPGAPPVAAPAPSGPAGDEIAWGFVKDTKDADQLRRFIEQFPTSARRGQATARLFALEQQKVAVVAPPVVPAPPPDTTPKPAVGDLRTRQIRCRRLRNARLSHKTASRNATPARRWWWCRQDRS